MGRVDSAPVDSVPVDSVPVESVPVESVPVESVPVEQEPVAVDSSRLRRSEPARPLSPRLSGIQGIRACCPRFSEAAGSDSAGTPLRADDCKKSGRKTHG